jgi:hypothetical protein
LEELKNIFYLVGSVLGIIGFIRTIIKREKCELNYKTELGDEVHPFLVCIRGDIYNLDIASSEYSFEVLKLPQNFVLSRFKYNEYDKSIIEESCFFPVIKEGETLCLQNDNLDMPKLFLRYEDKYHNKYFQTIEFNKSDMGGDKRIKKLSRSCYNISKRHFRAFWIWMPIKK